MLLRVFVIRGDANRACESRPKLAVLIGGAITGAVQNPIAQAVVVRIVKWRAANRRRRPGDFVVVFVLHSYRGAVGIQAVRIAGIIPDGLQGRDSVRKIVTAVEALLNKF